MPTELSINKFNFEIMNKNRIYTANFMIIGSSRVYQQQIISIVKDFSKYIETKKIVCITDFEEIRAEYEQIKNDNNNDNFSIHNSENIDELLNNIINIQKEEGIKLRNNNDNIYNNQKEYIVIIIDNIKHSEFSASLRTILFDGRQLGIKLILTCQYMLSLKPEIRANFDYIFFFGEKRNKSDLERMHKYFFGFFDKFYTFQKVYEKCVEDNSWCIVCNNHSRSNKIEDIVFYYTYSPNNN